LAGERDCARRRLGLRAAGRTWAGRSQLPENTALGHDATTPEKVAAPDLAQGARNDDRTDEEQRGDGQAAEHPANRRIEWRRFSEHGRRRSGRRERRCTEIHRVERVEGGDRTATIGAVRRMQRGVARWLARSRTLQPGGEAAVLVAHWPIQPKSPALPAA